jgi:hypothetical protein
MCPVVYSQSSKMNSTGNAAFDTYTACSGGWAEDSVASSLNRSRYLEYVFPLSRLSEFASVFIEWQAASLRAAAT